MPKISRILLLILFFTTFLHAQVISIGAGSELHTGMPIEPLARYSYTQQLFTAEQIGHSGEICQICFEYNISSNNFLATSGLWRIYLGHSALDDIPDWVNLSELSLVFDGNLEIDGFDQGIPASGWLCITLQSPFYYDGSANLLLAVNDNSGIMGHSGDDFFCFASAAGRALACTSMQSAIDLNSPPPASPKNWQTNLRLLFGAAVDAPKNLYGYYQNQANHLFWQAPQNGTVQSYTIYRNAQPYAQSAQCSFTDAAIQPNQSYYYLVQAQFTDGSVSGYSNEILVQVPPEELEIVWYESFEDLPAFSSDIPNWQNLDLNTSATWAWTHTDFPGNGARMAWLVFAPALCEPPLSNLIPVSGQNILMAAASIEPPNNDWLISPLVEIGKNAKFSFQARSYTPAYGLERLRILISKDPNATVESFLPLHETEYIQISANWQEYSCDLSQYQGQYLRIALNCVSVDAMALFIDDIRLEFEKYSATQNECLSPPVVQNYPNPAFGSFQLKSSAPFEAKIYNLKGQLLHEIPHGKSFNSSALKLPAGLYLIQIRQDNNKYTLKQVILASDAKY